MADLRVLRAPRHSGVSRRVGAFQASVCPVDAPIAPEPSPRPTDVDAVADAYARGHADAEREAARVSAEALAELRRELEGVHVRALADAQERVSAAIGTLNAISREQVARLESDAIEIAHGAVLAILGRAAAERTLIVDLVRHALEERGIAGAVTVRVALQDVECLREAGGRLPQGIEVVGDPSLEPGGCLLTNARGSIDAGLERQLAAFRAALVVAHRAGAADGA